MLTTNRNFFLVLLLSIVTFGIYPLYLRSEEHTSELQSQR